MEPQISSYNSYNYLLAVYTYSYTSHYILCLISSYLANYVHLVGLIDMRHLPDGDYKWICHAIDHLSKFNFAFPIETKDAELVASVFEAYM